MITVMCCLAVLAFVKLTRLKYVDSAELCRCRILSFLTNPLGSFNLPGGGGGSHKDNNTLVI